MIFRWISVFIVNDLGRYLAGRIRGKEEKETEL